MGSMGLVTILTRAIIAENNENAAVTDKNIIVVNHSPGSITSSLTFPGYCRDKICSKNPNENMLRNVLRTRHLYIPIPLYAEEVKLWEVLISKLRGALGHSNKEAPDNIRRNSSARRSDVSWQLYMQEFSS